MSMTNDLIIIRLSSLVLRSSDNTNPFLLCLTRCVVPRPAGYLNCVKYFRSSPRGSRWCSALFPLKSISRINFTGQRGASRVIRRGRSSFCFWPLNIACPAIISNPRHPVTPCRPLGYPALCSATFCRLPTIPHRRSSIVRPVLLPPLVIFLARFSCFVQMKPL